jgi:hypothetical protein
MKPNLILLLLFFLASIRNFSVTGNEVSLFPNPASEFITICINDASPACFYRAELTDMTGKVLMRMDMAGPEQRMDVSRITAGVYFIRVIPESICDSKEVMQRIVVMR